MNQGEKKLNKEQLAAVKHGGGPLLIVAGAGTGKTTVITERIKHLIFKKEVKPSEILSLTFTEKAATEMQERIDIAMPYGYTQMWIMTFHGFCDRVLRDEALQIGLDTGFKLLTEASSIAFLRESLFEFDLQYFRPLGNPNKFISGMLSHFSRLQDENITPDEYLKWVSSRHSNGQSPIILDSESPEEHRLELQKWTELANAYKKYDKLKVQNSYLDFGDLITKTLKLFNERPNILKKYQEKFKYILVDEFQDTNFAQNELAMLLAGKPANITVCGDDDQSIYRFRGASVSNIMQFRDNYPNAKVVVLTQNYRSTQAILDSAYNFIQHNNPDRLEVKEAIDKKLVSVKKEPGELPTLFHESTSTSEAESVVAEIKSLIQSEEFEFSDIAILVRANAHADSFIAALSRQNIPYQFLGPNKLFESPEIIDLISYLKVLYDPSDSVSLSRVLTMDQIDIEARDIALFAGRARKANNSLYEEIESEEKFSKLVTLIKKHLKEKRNTGVGHILYDFLQATGLINNLLNTDKSDAQTQAENISLFFEKIKGFEDQNPHSTLEQFVDWLDLSIELGESPQAAELDWSTNNTVNILTVHGSKGLEFPVVFLVNLVNLRFPGTNKSEQIPIPVDLIKEELPEGDFHLEEERRLFYVGMTRAREKLYLTAADFYNVEGRKKKLSPFIFEALGEDIASVEIREPDQLSILDYTPTKEQIQQKSGSHPVHYLSYSQIETFKICPLHYKLRYILKIPTPPSASLSFGSSIHAILNDFYAHLNAGNKATKSLLKKLLSKNWINAGYENKKHEQQMYEKGEITLSNFLKNEYDPSRKVLRLEQPFTIPLKYKGDYIRIGGKIDRIDELSKGTIEIIDYKTGENVPTQKDVDNNDQLSLYALAATRLPEEPFDKKPEEIKLTLYYLDSETKLTTTRTQEQLDQMIKEVFDTKKQIEVSDFKCSNHYLCQKGCEFSQFCRTENKS